MKKLHAFLSTLAIAIGFLAISGGAYAQAPFGGPLFAVLNGGNECNAAVVCRQGDLDAIGSVTITFPTATTVCWGINVDNLAGATAAHIHQNVSGLNGGIVVVLSPPNAPAAGNPGASSGCVGAAAATVTAIRNDPTRFYVNVHNGAFPNGAVRGQLH